jgi:uncharacterized membrane protein (DUF485 family)
MKIFWLVLTITSLVWYVVVTVFVSYKGIADIKGMFKRLEENKED